MTEPWKCPFCDRDVTITNNDTDTGSVHLKTDNSQGQRILYCKFVVCPNPKCKKFTLTTTLFVRKITPYGATVGKPLDSWNLIPSSEAKTFPEYVPSQIRQDYEEACKIKNLSPKASATLARRCLQGMIRDFWKVKGKSKLAEEIVEIKDEVEPFTWKAIDAVRSIGNIGAHMEEDINLIIDVDPNEAQQLINLIEMLIQDWYINDYLRKERLQEIQKTARNKKAQRKSTRARKLA